MRRRLAIAALACLPLAAPAPADAHGLVQRADLPLPEWLFAWAAGVVLVVSFAALAVLWREPRLEGHGDETREPGSVLRAGCGATGVALLAVVVWSGLFGVDAATDNFAPTFVFVAFWIGLVFASVLLGDVFRLFNPWGAVGRVLFRRARRPYPAWLGRWPAAAGILAFTWLELVSPAGESPRNVAVAALVYSALTWAAMARWGVDAWLDRGEAFSVYFGLFARVGPVWRPLRRLTALEPAPGTVGLIAVMIGTVTFDGFSQGSIWRDVGPELGSEEVAGTIGLVACVAIVAGFYALGAAGARTAGGGQSGAALRQGFAHSLVPIAVAYVGAHYLTFLLFQGQALGYLVSDPLGHGWDLLGTAGRSIDYGVIGQNAAWYAQVGLVVTGHVAALTLAHDRALVLYDRVKLAVRSQYWMLGVMVGFTMLALWLLASANA